MNLYQDIKKTTYFNSLHSSFHQIFKIIDRKVHLEIIATIKVFFPFDKSIWGPIVWIVSWLSGYRRLYWAVPGGMSPCLSEHCSTIMSRSEHCAGPGTTSIIPRSHVLWLILRCSQLSSLCLLSIDLGGDGAHLHTFDGFYRVQSQLECDQVHALKLWRGKSAPLDWQHKSFEPKSGKRYVVRHWGRGNYILLFISKCQWVQYIQYTFNNNLKKSYNRNISSIGFWHFILKPAFVLFSK